MTSVCYKTFTFTDISPSVFVGKNSYFLIVPFPFVIFTESTILEELFSLIRWKRLINSFTISSYPLNICLINLAFELLCIHSKHWEIKFRWFCFCLFFERIFYWSRIAEHHYTILTNFLPSFVHYVSSFSRFSLFVEPFSWMHFSITALREENKTCSRWHRASGIKCANIKSMWFPCWTLHTFRHYFQEFASRMLILIPFFVTLSLQ